MNPHFCEIYMEEEDIAIINYVSDELFGNYHINKDLLINWKVELVDNINDASILISLIEEEIVLGNLFQSQLSITTQQVEKFFGLLDNLDNDIYSDFKVIIFELFVNLLSSCYFNKLYILRQGITELLLDKFISYSSDSLSYTDLSTSNPNFSNQFTKLILSLVELGLDTKTTRKLTHALVYAGNINQKLLLLHLINQILSNYTTFPNFFLFKKYSVSLPIPKIKTKTLTLQFWFKFSSDDSLSTISLFEFTNSSSTTSSTLRVHLLNGNQISIEIKNHGNNSKFRFSFNQILEFIDHKFIYVVLTYDQYQNLNLYINGEYSESIPCPELHRIIESWDKLYIGNDDSDFSSNYNELMISNCTILDVPLTSQWVNLVYNLGINFDWNFNEFSSENIYNLLNQLTFKGYCDLSLKTKSIIGTKKRRNSFRDSLLADNDKSVNRNVIASSLIKDRITSSNITFNINSSNLLTENNNILIHNSISVYSSLYIIGGLQILLDSIESTGLNNELLGRSLDALFDIINNDWRLSKEFENINGYGILLILLVKHKPDLDIIKTIILKLGYSLDQPNNSIIVNTVGYRNLILSFDLFQDSMTVNFLLKQFTVFISESKYQEYNLQELNKMKFMKKFIQFMKSSKLVNISIDTVIMDEFITSFSSIIRSDVSVDNIKSIAHFIIYSFYSRDINPKLGEISLQCITNTLCESTSSMKYLKKFSRSITIHWILLLLSIEDKNVVNCGIRLLSKLLKILGPNIIKRFFKTNKGLNILTYFFKDWWKSDDILIQLYLSSFGLDITDIDGSYTSLSHVIEDPSFKRLSSKLVIPDFLILVNNLVLNCVYTLSERKGKVLSQPNSPVSKTKKNSDLDVSLDAIHLINEYSESIQKGFEQCKPLRSFYFDKAWLDGIFELIGYLKLFLSWEESELLTNFKGCYDNLITTVSNLFIARLFEGNDFLTIFNHTSDFTKKLILDLIFPKIFEHLNEFIQVSNFIFNEKDLMNESISLLAYYYNEYLSQNFYVSEADLRTYLVCILSIIENGSTSSNSSIKFLKNLTGNLIILNLKRAGPDLFDSVVRFLLERQITIFSEGVLQDQQVADVIILLLGIFFKISSYDNPGNLFNLLRTVHMMKQAEFPKLIEIMTQGVDYSAADQLINDFFETLAVKNDDESLKAILRYPTYKHIVNQRYLKILSHSLDHSKLRINDMIRIALNDGGTIGQADNIYVKSFERDCDQLKHQIIENELFKFNRANQDQQENSLHHISSFSSLKIEVERLGATDFSFGYALDYIESSDRMRCRLIVEDQLPDAERLAYQIDVPVKELQKEHSKSFEVYNNAIEINGINTGSLSGESFMTGPFEVIDNDQDIESEDSENSIESSYEDKNRKVLRSLFLGDYIVSLWNISQINGLAPIESLMILGASHLYIIENYFHQSDGNVVDVQDAPIELRDPYLQLINSQSNFVSKYSKSHRTKHWGLDTLSSISKRQFLLRDIALEMFFSDGASILLTCLSTKERDAIYSKLQHYCDGKGLDHDLSETLQVSLNNNVTSSFASKLSAAFSSSSSVDSYLTATKKWKNGEMSNFYYLMIINTLSGRTFNDLTQYPVFPWVIADYTSETLDLSDPKTFRDLSKPMGAQTEPRASEFKERYEALKSLHDPSSPAFHYGTHYSSAMIVTSYLIRLKPYVQSYLLLQGGKFDHADRLFNSIEKAWLSASKDNTTDVRELIPEFFYLPEFLLNSNGFEFGTSQNGEISNNVKLPKWAKNDPKIFIQKNREALESPYVSANLHLWIDLIFGYKQNGPAAVDSLNIFHHISYNGAINLDNINDELERKAVIGMINNFGQTPNKIFQKVHPKKEVLNLSNYYLSKIDDSKEPKLIFESKLKCPIAKIEVSSKSGKWVGRPSCIVSEDELLIRKLNGGSIIINNTSFLNIHESNITNVVEIGYKKFITSSEDGLINIWRCKLKPQVNLQFQGVLRGHISKIKEIKYSKSFKVGLSSDVDGVIILWDMVRFKFIRKFGEEDGADKLVDISNDTGNVMILNKDTQIMNIYSLNGDFITSKKIPEKVICVKFGSINDSMIETGRQQTVNSHIYWSEEHIGVVFDSGMKIYSLKLGEKDYSWEVNEIDSLNFSGVVGKVTSVEMLKVTDLNLEEKLVKGSIKLIIGDSSGRVYEW